LHQTIKIPFFIPGLPIIFFGECKSINQERLKVLPKSIRCANYYFAEGYRYVQDAITMEKKIKGWKRFKKTALIETINPGFFDLASELDNLDPSLTLRMTKRGKREGR
jgi:hypothetical protein